MTAPHTAATTASPDRKPGLTHPCARCGAPVPLDVGLCERCNPLGLRDVSSSQVHGIAIAGVAVCVIVLAVVGRFLLAGIGPFQATVANVVPAGAGLAITLNVTNDGSSAGQTTCRVTDPNGRSSGMGAFLLSPRIDPGATLTFTQTVTDFGKVPRPLEVECVSP